MDINEAVAAQLRAERAIARLTMDEVAARGVVSKSTLVRYEKGEREIPVSAVAALAEIYGITARKIFNEAATRMEETPAGAASEVQDPAETRAGTMGNVVEPSRRPHAPSPARAQGARGTRRPRNS